MGSPAKRSSRNRRGSVRDATVDRLPDSSPSRPAKRRKQVNDSPREIPEEEGSSLVADTSINPHDDLEVVNKVASHLLSPKDQLVQVTKDHANAIHEARSASGDIQAFAKVSGPGWTYYVTKTNINIGRTSDPPPQYQDENDKDFVHVDLGPSKMISRQHAIISFDSEWTLEVKGRNGLKVDGDPLKQGTQIILTNGRVIDIGGIEMIFVLPLENKSNPLRIHPTYLERAGMHDSEFASTHKDPHIDALPPSSSRAPHLEGDRVALPRGQPHPQAIAPAPPDYKRPGTPPSARSRGAGATQNTSPQFRDAGTMLMNANDVDLSLDENKHIKPQYSYAQMITQAIINTSDEKLNLNGIYTYIMSNYSYYRHQETAGWQNSIRHNLSLNKSFEKVPRSTDEPGKGMKWQIVADSKEEMIRSAFKGGRGGHRGSSNPSSPNQLNYVNQGPREMAAKGDSSYGTAVSSTRKRKVSPSGSPQPARSALRDSHMTPDRSSRRLLPGEASSMLAAGDGSPLPRLRKTAATGAAAASSAHATANATSEAGLEDDSATASCHHHDQPASPTLASSAYLQEDGGSFVTPAPHRVNLRLAPPSTAQRPSQHMPTSSPAPFWKYADIGSTPLKPVAGYDLSPSRPGGGGGGGLGLGAGGSSGARLLNAAAAAAADALGLAPRPHVASSSPPPAVGGKSPPAAAAPNSPTARHVGRGGVGVKKEGEGRPEREKAKGEEAEEEGGFDLTKGFQSIGSYHAPVGRGFQVAPAANGR